jgi:hypothetical protein
VEVLKNIVKALVRIAGHTDPEYESAGTANTVPRSICKSIYENKLTLI